MADSREILMPERRSTPACQDEVARMRANMDRIANELEIQREWREEHIEADKAITKVNSDLVAMMPRLQKLVSGLEWVIIAAKVTAYIGGSVLGTILFLKTVWPYIRMLDKG